jgi:hypothetical protein
MFITAVLLIRINWIRIHVFLGLLDPDPDPEPLVRGMDPDPYPNLDPSNIEQKWEEKP